METALSTISALPSGREQVARFVRQLKDEILANQNDPLKILVQLKYAEKTIKNVLEDKEVDLHFLKEFELYGKEKVVEIGGAKLNEQEVGVKYFYEETGDPEWMDLEKKIQELTEKKKEREKFLQNIPYDQGFIDQETGVFITRAPRKSQTKVVVKLIS